MRVLVIGALGQLGTDICAEMSEQECYCADVDGGDIVVDVTDRSSVQECIASVAPDVVINTAAEHEVETCEVNPDRAFQVNATGALYVAQACGAVKARLVHISTDYVFGGTLPDPLRPYIESDTPAPLNVYGASKRAGEHLIASTCHDHIIVRTAALYGLSPCRGKGGRNFVETMLTLAASGRDIKVVTDIYTSPTYTVALAHQLRIFAEKGTPGIYHAACSGVCSWYEFALAIFDEMGISTPIHAAKATDFQSLVHRPAYAALDNSRAQREEIDVMPDWRKALKEYAAVRLRSGHTTA